MPQKLTQCPSCNSNIAFYDSLLGDFPDVLSCGTCGWSKETSPQWGGVRPGQGLKPTWKSGKTRTIRVPIALADEVLAYARALDGNEIPGRSPSPWSQVGDVLSALPVAPAAPAARVPSQLDEAIATLKQALTLKANSGGAIKIKIREALELLEKNEN